MSFTPNNHRSKSILTCLTFCSENHVKLTKGNISFKLCLIWIVTTLDRLDSSDMFKTYIRSIVRWRLTAQVRLDLICQDHKKFKLWWKLDKVNIRLFCYYDFVILCHVAEIWLKMPNSAKKWKLRKLRSDDIFWKMMTMGDYLTTET